MDKKRTFGDLTAEDFEVGDIVCWKVWDDEHGDWVPQYGVLLEVQNELRSNRVVSVSKVMPLNEPHNEREFFTLTLEIVNKS
tara:strand:- start:427 stop:672 length:246 start_codon:yes stop_codon:yes gene_type:complete